MIKRIFIASAFFAFVSCSDPLGLDPNVNTIADGEGEPVNLFEMKAGQKSRYLRLTGENYSSPSWPDYDYSPDTLELSVIGKEKSAFILEEKITDFSESKTGANNTGIPNLNTSVRYLAEVSDDLIEISSIPKGTTITSNLFGAVAIKKRIKLSKELRTNTKFSGWKITKPSGAFFFNGITQENFILGCYYGQLFFEISEESANTPSARSETIAIHDSMGVVRKCYGYKNIDKGYGWDLITHDAGKWSKETFLLDNLSYTKWSLRKYQNKGITVDIAPYITSSYFFDLIFEKYKFGGHAGCNNYSGEFEHDNAKVFFYLNSMGTMTCNLSFDYIRTLEYAKTFSATSRHLIIYSDTLFTRLEFARIR